MVTIRLARGGSKKNPFYHIVVTDSRRPRDGGYIERLGYYNPMAAGNDIPLKVAIERAQYWLSQGAQASEKAKKLIKRAKKIAPFTKNTDQTEAAA